VNLCDKAEREQRSTDNFLHSSVAAVYDRRSKSQKREIM
jgi:hypothetical protein